MLFVLGKEANWKTNIIELRLAVLRFLGFFFRMCRNGGPDEDDDFYTGTICNTV